MPNPAARQTNDRSSAALMSVVLLGLLAAGVVAVATPSLRTLIPPCPFLALTGLYCPGCGSSRVFAELLHGNVGRAIEMNALIVALLPALAYVLVSDTLWLAGVRALPRLRLSPVAVRALAGVILAFWVLRNLPLEPFVWLAPGWG